ncbi:MAG TPA: NADH-ubiquinone oxidoreductase-F iron-sulfur binding region domain-containing protein [Mycobacteriales bacterium]
MTAATDVRAPVGPRMLVTGGGPSYAEHLARHGALPVLAPGQLIAAVHEARLTGRGGAGFPVWRKLETALAAGHSVVVANAAEGEPASVKDRSLLEANPQLVLDGLEMVAAAIGAERVVLAAREGASLVAAERAVADRTVARRGGVAVEVVPTPVRFLSGEESALTQHVGGGPLLPRTAPVWVSGVRGRPTLVHNVETLAQIALVARYGAAWFAGVGNPESPGSMLFSVSTAGRSGVRVVEAPTGTPYAQVLAAAGVPAAPQALLVGGYHGAWLPSSALELPATRVLLDNYDATAGAGVVVALEAGVCPLDVAARIVGYLAEQNAGQCGPCVNGLPALAGQMGRLIRGERGAAQHLERYAALVDGRGGCHHPDGTAGFVRSTLRTFTADVVAHGCGACAARGDG